MRGWTHAKPLFLLMDPEHSSIPNRSPLFRKRTHVGLVLVVLEQVEAYQGIDILSSALVWAAGPEWHGRHHYMEHVPWKRGLHFSRNG